jgi:hypothetical protein
VKEARDSGEIKPENWKTIHLRRNMESFEKRSRSLNKPPFLDSTKQGRGDLAPV